MRRSFHKTACLFVYTVSAVFILSACGVFELLGKQEKKTVVMPCLELIPTPTQTPTPAPMSTLEPTWQPLPLPTSQPSPPPPPPPSNDDCSDGPGTAVVCNGEVISTAEFIILPEPKPVIPTPTPATGIVLYAANGLYSGNLGGLSGANGICGSTSSRPLGYSQYIAFISEDIGNAISNFPTHYGVPTNFPVVSLGRNLVAVDWADLLGPPLGLSLYEAGVLPADSTWWSGSNSDGGLSFETCSDWTDAFPPEGQGSYGGSNYTDTRWISLGTDDCNIDRHLLCLAYNGTPPPPPTEVLVNNSVACGTFSDSCGVYSNQPCCEIVEAVSIAYAYNVDRIYVEDNSGPYTEQIFLGLGAGDSLTIEAGANVAIQAPTLSGAFFNFGPGTVTIRNFQLNGNTGAPLMYTNDGTLILEDNIFIGQGAFPASVLSIDNSGSPVVSLDGNSFSDLSTSGNVIECNGGSLSSAGNNSFSSGGAGISTTACETPPGAFTCTFSCPSPF